MGSGEDKIEPPLKGWPWEKAIHRQQGLLGNCSIG